MYSPDDRHLVSYATDDTAGYDAPPLPYVPYTSYTSYSPVPPVPPVPHPQSAIVTPDAPVPSQPMRSRRKRGVRLWLMLGLVTVLLVALGLSSFAFVSYLNRSTPEKTLKTFCAALQQGSYQVAYNQMTTSLQMQITESDFANALSTDKVNQCSYGTTSEATTTTRTSLKLVHSQSHYVNNDIVTLTKQGDSIWRISDLANAT